MGAHRSGSSERQIATACAGPVLVGLRAPDRQHDAAAVDELEVADVEPDDLGAPQGAAEAGEQDGAVAQTERRAGLGADHAGQHRGRDRRRLAGRAGALAPADAVQQQGDARVAGVERQADQAMGGDDGGEVDLQRRGGEALGRGGQVHADQPGIAAQRRQPEADAPGVVLAPGRAVGAQRARPARLGGVDGGLGGERADLVGTVRIERALGQHEVAEDAGRHHQPLPCCRRENLAVRHVPSPAPPQVPLPRRPSAASTGLPGCPPVFSCR